MSENENDSDSGETALVKARQQSLSVAGDHVLSFFVLDGSGSMGPFRKDLQEETQHHLDTLRSHMSSRSFSLGIAAFNTNAWMVQPIAPVAQLKSVPFIDPDGGTHLYATVAEVLPQLREVVAQLRQTGVKASVALMVLTDGQDSKSSPKELGELREQVSISMKEGILPILVGFGVDAKEIAKTMGFPEAYAYSVARTRAGMTTAMRATTHITMTMTYEDVDRLTRTPKK